MADLPKQLFEFDPLGRAVRPDDIFAVSDTGGGNLLRHATHAEVMAWDRWKAPVRTVDTAGLDPSSGAYAHGQSVGGVTLVGNADPALADSVLRATLGGHADDGIYTSPASGAAPRRVDAPSGGTVELAAGVSVYVADGLYARSYWRMETVGVITIGTTAQVWELASVRPIFMLPGTPPAGTFGIINGRLFRHDLGVTLASANQSYYSPFLYIGPTQQITKLSAYVSSSIASSNIKLAMYSMNELNGEMAAQLAVTGNLSAATTGIKIGTVTGFTMRRNVWYIGGVAPDSGNIGFRGSLYNFASPWGTDAIGRPVNLGQFNDASYAAALPSTPTAFSSLSLDGGSSAVIMGVAP